MPRIGRGLSPLDHLAGMGDTNEILAEPVEHFRDAWRDLEMELVRAHRLLRRCETPGSIPRWEAKAYPHAKEVDMIQVRRTAEGDPLEFEVVVREGKGETRHHATMARETCERLTGGKHTPERCLEAAFQFLLDREPKESILRRFDVTVISRYFPEFERELPRYLSRP